MWMDKRSESHVKEQMSLCWMVLMERVLAVMHSVYRTRTCAKLTTALTMATYIGRKQTTMRKNARRYTTPGNSFAKERLHRLTKINIWKETCDVDMNRGSCFAQKRKVVWRENANFIQKSGSCQFRGKATIGSERPGEISRNNYRCQCFSHKYNRVTATVCEP